MSKLTTNAILLLQYILFIEAFFKLIKTFPFTLFLYFFGIVFFVIAFIYFLFTFKKMFFLEYLFFLLYLLFKWKVAGLINAGYTNPVGVTVWSYPL